MIPPEYAGMKHRILPRAELDALCARMCKARDGGRRVLYERLRNRVIEVNVRFAYRIARRASAGDMPIEDRMQWAMIGLARACDKFDHTKGFAFSTYASTWVRQAVTRAYQETGVLIPVPKVVPKGAAYKAAMVAAAVRPLSLDESPWGATDETLGATRGDCLVDPRAVQADEAIEAREREEQAMRLMAGLTPREHRVIRMRFGMGCVAMTLEAIGLTMGVGRERIRQIEERALARMKGRAK